MPYWRLNPNCLNELVSRWKIYIANCYNSIANIYNNTNNSYYSKYKTYKTESYYNRYLKNYVNSKKWSNECFQKLEIRSKNFVNFFNFICEEYYSEKDNGYLIIYDFLRFEKRREYMPSLGNSFRVRFTGIKTKYEYNGYVMDWSFTPNQPEFIKIY